MASGSLIQFPLRLGLADDANKKSAPTSSLKRGHNIRWVRDGVVGKRFGFENIGDASNVLRLITRGPELSFTDGEYLYTYSPTLDSWVTSDRVDEIGLEWSTLIDDEAGVSQSDIVVYGNVLLHAYMTGDPSVQAGSDTPSQVSGALYVQAIDWTTGRMLMTPRWLGGADFLRLVLCGTYGVLVTTVGTQILSYRVQLDEGIGIDAEAVFPALANDVRSDGTPHGINSRLDAIVLESGELVVAYESDTALTIRKYTVASGIATVTGTPVEHAAENDVRCIALSESPGASAIRCAYCRIVTDPSCSVRFFAVDSASFSELVSPTDIYTEFRAHHISVAASSASEIALIAFSGVNERAGSVGASTDQWPETRSVVFDTNAEALVPLTMRASATVMLTSGLITIGSRTYAFARDAHYGERQHWDPTYTEDDLTFGAEIDALDLSQIPSLSSYLLEIESSERTDVNDQVPHRVVGKIDHDIAGPFEQGFTSRAALVDGDTILGCAPFQATAQPRSFNFRDGLRLVMATRDLERRSDPWRCATIAAETYIGGAGMLHAWDGRTVFDVAMRAPMIISARENSNDGLMVDGVYLYQVFAVYRSHSGILHRGPSSIVVSVGPNDSGDHLASVKLRVAPNSIDAKETADTGFGGLAALRSYFNIFRSEAGGSVLYERTFGPRFDVFFNQPTLGPQPFVDSANDSDIAKNPDAPTDSFSNPQVALSSRPQPYPATGELEDVQPVASTTMCLHLGRLFIVAGDRRTIWFSKAIEENPGIAPGFNSDFVRIFDRDVTALASFADRLIIFFERGAKFVVGDGPTVANTDDRFSPPQALQGEIGTENPRSLAVTPIGVFFQATGGDIYLLDGSLSMQWIGKDVRDQLETYPTVTSAVHVAEQAEVRITAKGMVTIPNPTGNTEEPFVTVEQGIMLVFDYRRGTWCTRSTPNDAPVVDACIWEGKYILATDEGVYVETDGHVDLIGGEELYIPMSVVFNAIAPSGPLSWHRVRLVQLLGTSTGPHNLTVSLARDYAVATEQSKVWNGSSSVTAAGPLERAQVAPRYQKMQAIEVHIEDAEPTYDDAGAHDDSFDGFELEGLALLVDSKSGPARIEKGKRG